MIVAEVVARFGDRPGEARRMGLGPMKCEACDARSPGGIARSVILDEPDGDTPWLRWMLADGWWQSDHGAMAACPEHQSDPLLKTLRFAG